VAGGARWLGGRRGEGVAPLQNLVGFFRGLAGVGGRSAARLSIDIGSSAVKVLEARETSGALIVSGVGYASLPPTAVQNNSVVEPSVSRR